MEWLSAINDELNNMGNKKKLNIFKTIKKKKNNLKGIDVVSCILSMDI